MANFRPCSTELVGRKQWVCDETALVVNMLMIPCTWRCL